MARPTSIALGGYFPTPFTLLPSLASLVSFADQKKPHVLVDPCAGDGAALAALRQRWFEEGAQEATIYAVELEQLRARDHRLHLNLYSAGPRDVSLHCDAFHVDITPQEGASLLYLNPPYDLDKVHAGLSNASSNDGPWLSFPGTAS
jgi:tRNA1(Val) A37 N6-methylase TrmN6